MDFSTYFIGMFSGIFIGLFLAPIIERFVANRTQVHYVQQFFDLIKTPELLKLFASYITYKFMPAPTNNLFSGLSDIIGGIMRNPGPSTKSESNATGIATGTNNNVFGSSPFGNIAPTTTPPKPREPLKSEDKKDKPDVKLEDKKDASSKKPEDKCGCGSDLDTKPETKITTTGGCNEAINPFNC
jgi:hypothetical protein